MNNHTHMLIKIKNIHQLSDYMKWLNSRYAQYYNYTYNRIGHVYRERFKSQKIYSDEQYAKHNANNDYFINCNCIITWNCNNL